MSDNNFQDSLMYVPKFKTGQCVGASPSWHDKNSAHSKYESNNPSLGVVLRYELFGDYDPEPSVRIRWYGGWRKDRTDVFYPTGLYNESSLCAVDEETAILFFLSLEQ
jgi:hypothetical protein